MSVTELECGSAVRLDPDAALDLLDLREIGSYLHARRRSEKAMLFFEEALRREPTDAETLANLGATCIDCNLYKRAEHLLNRSLAIQDNALAWFNLGSLEKNRGNFDRAIDNYSRALRFGKTLSWYDMIYSVMGLTEQYRGNTETAIQFYSAALEISPTNVGARTSLGILKMLKRDWQVGLWNYEARLYIHTIAWIPNVRVWSAEDPSIAKTAGTRILVWKEQGIGDLIHFARYGAYLKHAYPNAHLTLICSDDQKELLRLWPGWDVIHCPADGDLNDENYDLQIGLLSLPLMMMKAGHEPLYWKAWPNVGSLLPDRGNESQWDRALNSRTWIGFCHLGNPAHSNDKYRSLVPHELGPLFNARRDVFWSSFAKDDGGSLFSKPDMSTWISTAKNLLQQRLLISCDTAVAHLAASLGVETWLLVAASPDWRWGLTGERTFWYPSMRLFRQQKLGDWGPVIERVAEELKQI